jgi:hypothetical protein
MKQGTRTVQHFWIIDFAGHRGERFPRSQEKEI